MTMLKQSWARVGRTVWSNIYDPDTDYGVPAMARRNRPQFDRAQCALVARGGLDLSCPDKSHYLRARVLFLIATFSENCMGGRPATHRPRVDETGILFLTMMLRNM